MKRISPIFFDQIVKIAFVLSAIILCWITTNISFGKNDWRGIIESDAKGYYAYLPAVFIYNDLNFGFKDSIEDKKYKQNHLFYEYRSLTQNGKFINKYYSGTALAQLPFFLVAHALTILNGGDADGYSKYYMLSICVAAIFYCLLGVWFMVKLLRLIDISEGLIALLILILTFGTHLFIYTISEGGMSHIYSFALISAFIYYSKIFFITSNGGKLLPILGFLLGFIILCRPINGLVIFSWLALSKDFKGLKINIAALFAKWKYSLIALIICLSIIFIQLFIYKISAGQFWLYSYENEGFDFSKPEIMNILFSYKKGLFLYTPIIFLSFLSSLFLLKSRSYFSVSWLLFFALLTIVFSSWWVWFYGGSFSSRVYVEYLSLLLLPLAIFMNELKKMRRKLLIFFSFILIVVCQIQSYQYRYYEIHYSEMTREKYWNVLLTIIAFIDIVIETLQMVEKRH